jgi:hypothetical protein
MQRANSRAIPQYPALSRRMTDGLQLDKTRAKANARDEVDYDDEVPFYESKLSKEKVSVSSLDCAVVLFATSENITKTQIRYHFNPKEICFEDETTTICMYNTLRTRLFIYIFHCLLLVFSFETPEEAEKALLLNGTVFKDHPIGVISARVFFFCLLLFIFFYI